MEIKCRTGSATLTDGLVTIRRRLSGRSENRIPVESIIRIENKPPRWGNLGALAFHPAGVPVTISNTDPHVLRYTKGQQDQVRAFVVAVEAARSGSGQHGAP